MTAKTGLIRKLADLVNKRGPPLGATAQASKLMLIAVGLWLEIAKGFQDLLQCWRVFAIARFISGRENNVSHGVWQLHVSHTLPLGVGLCRGIFVDEIVAAVGRVAGGDFFFRFAVHFFHSLDRPRDKFVHIFELRAG